jgi:hypothetical protein
LEVIKEVGEAEVKAVYVLKVITISRDDTFSGYPGSLGVWLLDPEKFGDW